MGHFVCPSAGSGRLNFQDYRIFRIPDVNRRTASYPSMPHRAPVQSAVGSLQLQTFYDVMPVAGLWHPATSYAPR